MSVQVKVSQRLSGTTTGDWLGDSLSDMTPANTWTCRSSSSKDHISPLLGSWVQKHTEQASFTCEGLKLASYCCLIKQRVAAALVASTHSPDFPCSPSDFIPSSEGSFPEDSRICQVCGRRLSGQTQRQNSKNPPFSSGPHSNHDHFKIFPTKNQAQLTPGNKSRSCRCVFPSLSVPVQSDSHGFNDTVQSAPPPQLKWFTR